MISQLQSGLHLCSEIVQNNVFFYFLGYLKDQPAMERNGSSSGFPFDQREKESRDPCTPYPCGPGTTCTVHQAGHAICKCLPGFIPRTNAIQGCHFECATDSDCLSGRCLRSKCVPRISDPCNPSPCGPGTICEEIDSTSSVCNCKPGWVPKPDTITGCGPE